MQKEHQALPSDLDWLTCICASETKRVKSHQRQRKGSVLQRTNLNKGREGFAKREGQTQFLCNPVALCVIHRHFIAITCCVKCLNFLVQRIVNF